VTARCIGVADYRDLPCARPIPGPCGRPPDLSS